MRVLIKRGAQPQDIVGSKEAAQLPAILATSRARGYELKVALLSGFQDLGIATWMWLGPREYARHLGAELSLVYHGHLLVLMRNGYGVYFAGPRAAGDLTSAAAATRGELLRERDRGHPRPRGGQRRQAPAA
jgi:hypothetical protein